MTTFLDSTSDGAILMRTQSQPETHNALPAHTVVQEFVQVCKVIRLETLAICRPLPIRQQHTRRLSCRSWRSRHQSLQTDNMTAMEVVYPLTRLYADSRGQRTCGAPQK